MNYKKNKNLNNPKALTLVEKESFFKEYKKIDKSPGAHGFKNF